MNFSNSIKFSGLSAISPNSSYLAIVKTSSIIIYENDELKVIQKFTFSTPISHFMWSPDSDFILIAFYKTGICEVRSITNPKWICTINESQSGIIYARWTPDSRKIILFNDFCVRCSIWSLVDKSTVYINSPKFANKGIAFCENGNFMALAEKDGAKDFIGIYFTGDFTLVSRFQVDTFDLSDILWGKDASTIIVIDSDLECRLLAYSPTGNLLGNIVPYNNGLGVEICKFSGSGNCISAGFGDGTLRIFNARSLKEVCSLSHSISTITNEMLVSVFKEEEIQAKNKFTKYVECSFPYKLHNKGKNISGTVSLVEWNFDSKYVATKFDILPNIVFIWEANALMLHTVIIQIKPVKEFKWNPSQNILLIVTENSKLYTYTMENIYIVELVSDTASPFSANKIQWATDGRSFIISDKKQMIIGHPYNFDNMKNNSNSNIINNNEFNMNSLRNQSHNQSNNMGDVNEDNMENENINNVDNNLEMNEENDDENDQENLRLSNSLSKFKKKNDLRSNKDSFFN